MIAFIKRRWILLSCAVGLIALGAADIDFTRYGTSVPPMPGVAFHLFGLFAGDIRICSDHDMGADASSNGMRLFYSSLHRPMWGQLPALEMQGNRMHISCPIWLLLLGIFGLILLRELLRTSHPFAAFLQRRWILLLATLPLLSFSVFDLTVYDTRGGTNDYYYGLTNGAFNWMRYPTNCFRQIDIQLGTHTPAFGELPLIGGGMAGSINIQLPLWLPLSAILGWLVFRELRFREKRAKAAEAADCPRASAS